MTGARINAPRPQARANDDWWTGTRLRPKSLLTLKMGLNPFSASVINNNIFSNKCNSTGNISVWLTGSNSVTVFSKQFQVAFRIEMHYVAVCLRKSWGFK
jgi:hypothetical protein